MAPNARLWKLVDTNTRPSYVAICLYDFARIKIELNQSLLYPNGSLRETAEKSGPRMVDRVRGLDFMLRFYYGFHPSNLDLEVIPKVDVADVSRYVNRESELASLLSSWLPKGKIMGIDEIRHVIMQSLRSQGTLASSFVVDEWLKMAIPKLNLTLLKSAYTRMDSLIIDGFAYNALAVRGA
jgi:hypothetical protein